MASLDRMAQTYRLVDSDDEESTKVPLRRVYDGQGWFQKLESFSRTTISLVALVVTVAITFGFAAGYFLALKTSKSSSGLSPYLKLEYGQTEEMHWTTQYSDEKAVDSELNRLWDTQIPWEAGIIALPNEEARALNLPESQPFPWDSKHKSLYIVNAHHLLHCVRNLYISIEQYRTNVNQTINHPHILHCLDMLRVEVMCTADDTLRYVPLNSAHGYRPGDGQPRKCRNWDVVERYVQSHDPCYRYLKPGDTEISNLERFKFCPESSGYLPKIRKHFGYDDNWVPEPQEGPRELTW